MKEMERQQQKEEEGKQERGGVGGWIEVNSTGFVKDDLITS